MQPLPPNNPEALKALTNLIANNQKNPTVLKIQALRDEIDSTQEFVLKFEWEEKFHFDHLVELRKKIIALIESL